MKDITFGFLNTALWATTDYDGKNLDDNHYISDIPEELVLKAEKICEDFLERAWNHIHDDEQDLETIGHDLFLTMHGHGAGFWDGDYVEGDKLTELCGRCSFDDELRDCLSSAIDE